MERSISAGRNPDRSPISASWSAEYILATRSFGFAIPSIVSVVFSFFLALTDPPFPLPVWAESMESNETLRYMSAYGVSSNTDLSPLLFL